MFTKPLQCHEVIVDSNLSFFGICIELKNLEPSKLLDRLISLNLQNKLSKILHSAIQMLKDTLPEFCFQGLFFNHKL